MTIYKLQIPAGMSEDDVDISWRRTDKSKTVLVTVNKSDEVVITKEAAPAPAPTPVPPGWMTIANEGQPFTVTGTKTVRYGADNRWTQKTVTGGGQCTNAFFGDPAVGTVKSCQVSLIEPTPAPAPVPPPVPVPAGKPYTNPIIPSPHMGDPTVIRSPLDGRFYACFSQLTDALSIWTADKMQGPYSKGPVIRPSMWAPDLYYHPENKTFYLYGQVGVSEGLGIKVTSSPSLQGPVTEIKKLITDGIDAHVFRDDDGSLYFFWSSPKSEIFGSRMSDPVTLLGSPVLLLTATEAWEQVGWPVVESPFIVKRNGVYYMIYAAGSATNPAAGTGYATSHFPLGPYAKHAGNPIFKQSAGVYAPEPGEVIRDSAGDYWFFYCQKANNDIDLNKRFICIDKLNFDANGVMSGTATRGTSQPGPR